MNSTLISQHELTVRQLAPVRPAHVDVSHVDVAHVPVASQASTRPSAINPVNIMSITAWLGGQGSTVNTSVFAPKRPTTRLLAEALT